MYLCIRYNVFSYHNGENLAQAITDTLQSWGLESKNQVCLTTNNGSNILRAVKAILNWTCTFTLLWT